MYVLLYKDANVSNPHLVYHAHTYTTAATMSQRLPHSEFLVTIENLGLHHGLYRCNAILGPWPYVFSFLEKSLV